MAAVAAAMLGLLALLMLRTPADHMALLYADLDPREAGQVIDVLERQHVPHQLAAGGGQIMVPADQVARLRLLLAKDGLPTGGSIGYEIFDRGDGLTANQFQQELNQTRALEGELARTIRAIAGVRAARVHLVLPRREPFAREQQDAQASRAAHHGRRRADGQRGRAGDPEPGRRRGAGSAAAEHRHHRQPRQRAGARRQPDRPPPQRRSPPRNCAAPPNCASPARSRKCWRRSLGPGRVRAEATVEMNFDQVARNPGTLRPRRAGGAQHPVGERQQPQHRSAPPRSRCRTTCRTPMPAHASSRQPGAEAGGNHQLRDRQDRAHPRARAAADPTGSASPCWSTAPRRRAPTASPTWRPRTARGAGAHRPPGAAAPSASTTSAATASRW